jgi:FixJ family two-component response regulator
VSKEPLVAVIDDDDSFRAALAESLFSFGYDVREFASAEDFLAAEGECDCIVTDIHMPGMSGIDLTQALRGSGRMIPVIMITARAEPGLEVKAAASGAVCLLRKPFDAAALVDSLQRALRA